MTGQTDHLASAARHLRAAEVHLLKGIDHMDTATANQLMDMLGELHKTRLHFVAKGLTQVEPHRHMQFEMSGGPITEYECDEVD